MKKLLVFVLLLSGIVGLGQLLPTIPGYTNLNQKYQWRGGVFYERLSPPDDTTRSKLGFAIRTDGTYYGNGTWWTKLVSGTGTGYINPLTELGQIIYAEAAGVQTALTGNKTTTPKILQQIGDGVNSAAPGWTNASRYLPVGELPGDNIVAIGNSLDFTNFHNTVTFNDGLAAPGNCPVTWVSGLTFHVGTPCSYNIAGVQHTFGGGDVTLLTADPSNDRQDAIVVNTSNAATSIQGTAQPNPEVPTPDATEIFLTSVFVGAGATTPTQLGQVIVRDVDYAAGDWFISRTATVDSIYATNPFHSTLSLRMTAATNNQYFQYNSRAGAKFSKSNYNYVIFYIRNNAALNNARVLQVRLFNLTVQVGVALSLSNYGYSKSTINSYQTVAVPMSAFTGADLFTGIRITNTGTGGTVDVQFDYVQLQSGIVTPPPAASGLFGRTDIANTTGTAAAFNLMQRDFNFNNGNIGIGSPLGVQTLKIYAPDGTGAVMEAAAGVSFSIIGGNALKLQAAAGSGYMLLSPNAGLFGVDWATSGNASFGNISVTNPSFGVYTWDLQPVSSGGSGGMRIRNIPDQTSSYDSLISIKDGVIGRVFGTGGGGGGGAPSYTVATAVNTANYTITTSNFIKLADLTGQANRTVTLPTGVSGASLIIYNMDASAFNWSFSGTVKDWGNNTITTLADQTVYQLIYDGSVWQIIN